MDARRQFFVSVPLFLLAPAVLVSAALFLPAPAALADEPVTPEKPIKLFNGKDLTGFTTWLKATGRNDPQARVQRSRRRDSHFRRGPGIPGHGQGLQELPSRAGVQVGQIHHRPEERPQLGVPAERHRSRRRRRRPG